MANSVDSDLLQAISDAIGAVVSVQSTAPTDGPKLFEAYVLTIVLEAASAEGAQISYKTPTGADAKDFIFRAGPGFIWSTIHAYTYALIEFDEREPLEAHLSVRFSGRSQVLHELDVSVLRRSEAIACRNLESHPRASKALISAECKFYATPIGVGLARGFIGLTVDVRPSHIFFVMNSSPNPAEKLLAHHKKQWANNVSPAQNMHVDQLKTQFQIAFRNYKVAAR